MSQRTLGPARHGGPEGPHFRHGPAKAGHYVRADVTYEGMLRTRGCYVRGYVTYEEVSFTTYSERPYHPLGWSYTDGSSPMSLGLSGPRPRAPHSSVDRLLL